MTNEERDLITKFIERVGGPAVASGGFAGSVPATGTPPLPPVDPEADKLLSDLFTRYPEARYRITQVAFVQEHAVAAAANQITQLQQQISQLQQQLQNQPQPAQAQAAPSPWGQQGQVQGQAPAQPQPAPSRGIFGGLFGGGQSAAQPAPQQQYQQPAYAPPPQQPQYAPGYQPGMFQRSGSGFLGSALTTAAGVAGGMMAANALSGLFSGHHDSQSASFGGGGFGGGAAGNVGQANPAGESAPWATPALGTPDPADQGGEAKDYPAQQAWSQPADTGWQNAAAPAPAPAQDSGWQNASNTDSGWSDSSGGSDVDNS